MYCDGRVEQKQATSIPLLYILKHVLVTMSTFTLVGQLPD